MPEYSLEELQQLAQPALQHAELVQLASTQSPNKAYELASTQWPRRQAKAVRFLAILRRDHGMEAMQAFISSMEHARPKGTGHAQGDSMITATASFRPEFLYPISRQYPFDEVCEQIVRELEARNWNVPGIKIKFDVYGTGAQKFRMVREISGDDFRIYFSRPQRTMIGGRWNDVAAVNSITLPRQAIRVYEDESGPTYSLYVGGNWDADRDWFINSHGCGVNSKLYNEPRRYLMYKGGWFRPEDPHPHYSYTRRRAPMLVHNTDLNREYSPEPLRLRQKPTEAWAFVPDDHPERKKPKHDAPAYMEMDKVMKFFADWVLAHVLIPIMGNPFPSEKIDAFVEPEPVPMPEAIGPLFTFGENSDADRISRCKQGPASWPGKIHLSDLYGMLGSPRFVTLGVRHDGSFPKVAYDGFLWCGLGQVTPEIAIDTLEVPGHYRWTDREQFVIKVVPNNATGVYVADWALYEKSREATFAGKPNDFRASDADVAEWQKAAARTLVPITEYKDGYEKPVVLINRELSFDEVEVISGPWPDKHER